MTEYVIVAKISACAGYEKYVAGRIDDLGAATRRETGCLRYEIYRDLKDEAITLIYEVWANHAAWRQHVATQHLQAFKAEVLNEMASMSVEKLVHDFEG